MQTENTVAFGDERMPERFWAKIDRAANGCWLWTAAKTTNGYAQFGRGGAGAHRKAYIELVGAVPDGLVLDHLCRTPLCVNPAHLEPVTQRENTLRGIGPAAQHALKTHCPQGHPYAGENLFLKPLSYGGFGRECRTCIKDQARRHREKVNADPEALERKRAYQREWARKRYHEKKNAAQ